jgi:O-antigen/teichoic acid export membrane protein
MAKKVNLFERVKNFFRKESFKILGFQILELILVIVIVILGFLTFIGLLVWANDPANIGYLIITLLFILPIVACILGIKIIEERLLKYRPRKKLTKDDIKQLLYASIPIIIAIVAFQALNSYINFFPKNLSDSIAIEIFKVLIQTNGFLIGFVGIVFAQLLWAIHNQQSNIQKSIIENPPKEKLDPREDYLDIYERKRTRLILSMIFAVIPLLISILLSLSGLAQTDLPDPLRTDPYLIYPFWAMAYGIFIFIFSIVQSKMDIRLEMKKILVKQIITTKAEVSELQERISENEEKLTELADQIEKVKKSSNPSSDPF